jgi:hypothetical protein
LRVSGSSRIFPKLGYQILTESKGLGGVYYVNAVEITFALAKGASNTYSGLIPRQRSGPESWYFRTEGSEKWVQIKRGPGTGVDDPEPRFRRAFTAEVIYCDSPGPNMGPFTYRHPD